MRVRNRLRHDNCIRIVERLWRYPGKSRTELARDLRLDRSTVGQLADSLVEAGLLEQATDDSSGPNGGRPPARLRIRPGYGYALGLELTSPVCRVVAIDLSGKVLIKNEFACARLGSDLVAGIISEVSEARRGVNRDSPTTHGLLTVGVGVSGIVSEREGRIDLSHALGITTPIAVASAFHARLELPMVLLNDAQTSAIGESGLTGTRDLLLALVEFRSPADVGVGLGIVLGGRLRRGRAITHLLRPEGSGGVAFLDSLAHALALVANATGVSDVVLAGDIDGDFDELRGLILEHVQRSGPARPRAFTEISVRKTESGVWSVSSGASYAAVQRLLHARELPIDTVAASGPEMRVREA